MEQRIERLLLAARWLLLPLYVALLAAIVPIYASVGREALHLIAILDSAGETEITLLLLSMVDFVLIANLVLMVAVSSYESFISKIEIDADRDKPEWLGKLDSGGVKVKVALSIVMISAIHLLRAFMQDADTERMAKLGATHLVFVISAFLLAWVDRMGRTDGGH